MRMTLTPLALTLADEIEHSVDLGDRQGRRRLVHDEDQGIERHRASDRYALTLAAGKILDLEPRARHADAEMRQHLCGVRMHLALVHDRHAKHALERLPAKQEVARDIDRVAERQVLINHLDPLTSRVGGGCETDFTAVEMKAAGIGNDGAGQNLAERRLSRAVVADEPKNLASAQYEVDAIKRLDGAEGLADVLHLDPDRRVGAQHPLGLHLRAKRKESGTPKRPGGRFEQPI